jgi:hypothetical protein
VGEQVADLLVYLAPDKNQIKLRSLLMQDYIEDLLDIQYDDIDDDFCEDYSDI